MRCSPDQGTARAVACEGQDAEVSRSFRSPLASRATSRSQRAAPAAQRPVRFTRGSTVSGSPRASPPPSFPPSREGIVAGDAPVATVLADRRRSPPRRHGVSRTPPVWRCRPAVLRQRRASKRSARDHRVADDRGSTRGVRTIEHNAEWSSDSANWDGRSSRCAKVGRWYAPTCGPTIRLKRGGFANIPCWQAC